MKFSNCGSCCKIDNYFITGIRVTIVSNPTGTPVDGLYNTFDYPIASSVTLMCMVLRNESATTSKYSYQWNKTDCPTAQRRICHDCFPQNQTAQNISIENLLAKDAGRITCSASVDGVPYLSEPLTLRISGMHCSV